jgi:hypothetical protein
VNFGSKKLSGRFVRFPKRRTGGQWLLLVVVGIGFTLAGLTVIAYAIGGISLQWDDGGPMSLTGSFIVGVLFAAAGLFVLIRPDHTWVDLEHGVVCAWTDDSHTFRSKCRLDEFNRVILETNIVSEARPNSAKTDASALVDYSIYLVGEKSKVLLDSFDEESEATEAGMELSTMLGLEMERTLLELEGVDEP